MQERMFIQTICPLVHVVRTQMRQRCPRYTHGNVYYFVACEVLVVMLALGPASNANRLTGQLFEVIHTLMNDLRP